jgi:hypothetical protein
LGVRTLLELNPYIEATYEEASSACTICMEKVFLGDACPQPRCPVKLHRHCYDTYRQNRPVPLCPACQQPWPRPNAPAADAEEADD